MSFRLFIKKGPAKNVLYKHTLTLFVVVVSFRTRQLVCQVHRGLHTTCMLGSLVCRALFNRKVFPLVAV